MKINWKYIFAQFFIILGFVSQAWAQCSTCKGVAQTKNADGEYMVSGINAAILYLLALPLFLPIIYGLVWWFKAQKKKKLQEAGE